MKKKSPEDQLAGFIRRYAPEIAEMAHAARSKLQELLPGAVEMVYDNYNAAVIGFGPTDRPSEAILSLVLYPRWINVCFLHGAKLSDPLKLLTGNGKQVRSLRLRDAGQLDTAPVCALIEQAVEQSTVSFDETMPHQLVIRFVSPTKRSRRPTK
jgi:hypothetical protein